MTRVLKGEAIGIEQIGPPLIGCVVIATVAVWFVARTLRSAAIK
jgi:hypothetical protein